MIYLHKIQKYLCYLFAYGTRTGTSPARSLLQCSLSLSYRERAGLAPALVRRALIKRVHVRCSLVRRVLIKRVYVRCSLVRSVHVRHALINALMTSAMICVLALLITSCAWPGAQQTSQPDLRLKAFHVLSARIIMTDTQAEVDGSLQNTSRSDRFPYDVTVIATFYNSAGNIVGQAGGVAEDVYPGMVRPFILVGQVDSTQYTHMVVTVVSLKERRIEKIIPTPSIVP